MAACPSPSDYHTYPLHGVPSHVPLTGVTALPGRSRAILRRLWPAEAGSLRRHLSRLDEEDRHLRFGRTMSDSDIAEYCGQIDWLTDTVFGLFIGTELRGSGILTPIELRLPLGGSAYLCVEKPYQRCGHGRRILERLLLAAQNRFYREIFVLCLTQNTGMRRLAESFGGRTDTFRDETESLFDLAPPSPLTMGSEMIGECEAYAFGMGLGWMAGAPLWPAPSFPSLGVIPRI